MNLLRADIQGSVGELTGARYKGKSVIKGKIWSKAPANETQTKSVRAFEALNRISSAIARQYWQWLGLSAGKMLKHNAVAQWLKPVVKEHDFELANIADVIPNGDRLELENFKIDAQTGEVTAKIVSTLDEMDTGKQSYWFCICDGKGTVLYSASSILPQQELDFFAPLTGTEPYYFFAFSSTKTEVNGKIKYILSDFNIIQEYPFAETVPFTLSNPTFAVNTAAGNLLNLTFESSEELPIADVKNVGATAYGVLQGRWITATQKLKSEANGNYFIVPLSDGVDNLQQRLLFPVGGKISVPKFRFYFDGKLYTHEEQELAFSESLPQQTLALDFWEWEYQDDGLYYKLDDVTEPPTALYAGSVTGFTETGTFYTGTGQAGCLFSKNLSGIQLGLNPLSFCIDEQTVNYNIAFTVPIVAAGISYAISQQGQIAIPENKITLAPFASQDDFSISAGQTTGVLDLDMGVNKDVTDLSTIWGNNPPQLDRIEYHGDAGTLATFNVISQTEGIVQKTYLDFNKIRINFVIDTPINKPSGAWSVGWVFKPYAGQATISGKSYEFSTNGQEWAGSQPV